MLTSVVLTVIGPDRTGLVESLATVAAEHGANWLESHMARVAGRFAGVVHLQVAADRAAALDTALQALGTTGLTLIVQHADQAPPGSPPGSASENSLRATPPGKKLRLELIGHDRPGIVREITGALAEAGISVVEIKTTTASAPMTGETMFKAQAQLVAPAGADLDAVRDRLDGIADQLHLDLDLTESP